MFGEILGIWCYSMWQHLGSPKNVNLIELGPGTGALLKDMLRTLKKFKNFLSNTSIHLVEISPKMRLKQAESIGVYYPKKEIDIDLTMENENRFGLSDYSARSKDLEIDIHWHQRLSDVPNGFNIIIAHEFFDALPVYQLQYTNTGWKERFVDLNPDDGESYFRFTTSKKSSFASQYLKDLYIGQSSPQEAIGSCTEISTESMAIAQEIGIRLGKNGGFALIFDYGYDYSNSFTLRAIKAHGLVDPLINPGSSDLSCMVDFNAIKKSAITLPMNKTMVENKSVKYFGPVTQQQFLLQNGIEARLSRLLLNCKDETTSRILINSFNRLIDPKQMGQTYKVLCIGNSGQIKEHPPGFFEF